jgi:hypothetical protein
VFYDLYLQCLGRWVTYRFRYFFPSGSSLGFALGVLLGELVFPTTFGLLTSSVYTPRLISFLPCIFYPNLDIFFPL